MSQTAIPAAPPTETRKTPDPAAMKARVISHMNADHQLSIRGFLQYYSNVPSLTTKSSQMEDINNEHMILTSGFGRHVIPFTPPLKSLGEARERLVAMHNESFQALGVSDIVVDAYFGPDQLWEWIAIAFIILILVTFPFRNSLLPESNSIIYQIWSLGGLAPSLAKLCYTLAPYVWWFIIAAHGLECVWFAKSRLRKHWVEVGSSTWFLWQLDCALRGYGAIKNFNEVVEKKQQAKGGRGKH